MASSLTMWQPKQISLWLNCKDFLKLVINIEQLSLLSYRVCTSPHTRGGGGEELWVGKMGVMLLSCSPVLCCRLLVPAAAGGWFQLRRGSTKAVGIRDKHPEAKGYWVRNLSIPDLGPWNFDTGKTSSGLLSPRRELFKGAAYCPFTSAPGSMVKISNWCWKFP